ncbi:MAG: hypothetical protein OXI56_07830 [bacterium]|nr:hypothetical protein [bacterium]
MTTTRAITLMALVLASCGGDAHPPTTEPAPATTINTVPPRLLPPTTQRPAERADVESDLAEVAVEDECPVGTHAHEGGECHPDHRGHTPITPEEVAKAGIVILEALLSADVCEAAGGGWNTDTQECGPLATAQDPHPEPEGDQDREEPLEEHVQGEVAERSGSADELVVEWWRPGLIDEAVARVDPHFVGADDWHLNESERDWGTYRFYRFYHGLREDSTAERETFWQAIQLVHNVQLQMIGGIYFPYRYDVAWVEYPNRIAVMLTFPLGEELTVAVTRVGGSWAADWGVEFPLGPPIRPTTPFSEPRFPGTAQALGRGCPPVEEVWRKNQPVEDPCTLQAVRTAIEYAWSGALEQRMAAVRDGQVLADLLEAVDNIQDPFIASGMGPVGRAAKAIEIRGVKWRGGFAQASMILLEWRAVWPVRDLSEEERQAAIRYYEWSAAHGREVSEERLRGDFQLGGPVEWTETLMVRTADGTWRQSYRDFCDRMDHTIPNFPDYVPEKELRCPDDPTPHFPDSRFFDQSLPPPNTRRYYVDPRANDDPNTLYRLDRGLPRLEGEYSGVPPS